MLLKGFIAAAVIGSLVVLHYGFRSFAQKRYRPAADEHKLEGFDIESIDRAFIKSTGPLRSIFLRSPSGWHVFNRRRLSNVFYRAGVFIKKLNDTHIQPDGSWLDEVNTEAENETELPEQQTEKIQKTT
jgi:hypothetical protein